MRLAYIDESYRRHHQYWLAACVIDESKVVGLCQALEAALSSIPPEFGITAETELHAQHLFHGNHDFRSLKDMLNLRAQLMRRAAEAVSAAEPRIFLIGAEWNDNLAPTERLAAHRMAVMRRLFSCLEDDLIACASRCIVIADEEETSNSEVVSMLRRHQSSCEERGSSSRILDGPLFTPSHHSYGVQACDVVAFIKSRHEFMTARHDRRSIRAGYDWWNLLRPHVVKETCAPSNSVAALTPERTEGRGGDPQSG
ncbi:MAG: DUF3800 domain-containing protein [Actinomycetes bacterium]